MAKTEKTTAKLSSQQEKFCQGVASGLNQSASYRKAYPKSLKWKDESVNCNASQLMADTKVKQRVDEIRAPVVAAAQVTLADHLTDLKSLRDKADTANQFSAAISAEVSRGKASGLYVEKVEHSGNVTIMATSQDERI